MIVTMIETPKDLMLVDVISSFFYFPAAEISCKDLYDKHK